MFWSLPACSSPPSCSWYCSPPVPLPPWLNLPLSSFHPNGQSWTPCPAPVPDRQSYEGPLPVHPSPIVHRRLSKLHLSLGSSRLGWLNGSSTLFCLLVVDFLDIIINTVYKYLIKIIRTKTSPGMWISTADILSIWCMLTLVTSHTVPPSIPFCLPISSLSTRPMCKPRLKFLNALKYISIEYSLKINSFTNSYLNCSPPWWTSVSTPLSWCPRCWSYSPLVHINLLQESISGIRIANYNLDFKYLSKSIVLYSISQSSSSVKFSFILKNSLNRSAETLFAKLEHSTIYVKIFSC